MSNYYDDIFDSKAYSIEQATLAEDLKFSELKPVEGKFYLKVLTPMVNSKEVSVRSKANITSANYITLPIPTYLLFQFMNIEVKTIKIPTKMDPEYGNPTKFEEYNVLCCASGTVAENTKSTANTQGIYTIPKGTIFLVEFLGGHADTDKIFIVGISPFKFIEE